MATRLDLSWRSEILSRVHSAGISSPAIFNLACHLHHGIARWLSVIKDTIKRNRRLRWHRMRLRGSSLQSTGTP